MEDVTKSLRKFSVYILVGVYEAGHHAITLQAILYVLYPFEGFFHGILIRK